jgi:phosphate transport system substrate-binding protein
MITHLKKLAVLAAFSGLATVARPQASTIDQNLADYTPVSGISVKLTSIGSDTLNNLMTYWAEDFQKIYPNVKIEIEGKGSSTAPPALISGTAQIGPMSRKMKAEEIDAFEKQYGYKPRIVAVAIDALAVYVNKDNPLESLTLQQVDAIFSATRKRGGQEIKTWGQLGLTGEWANKPISLYGRNSASGTYGFFKEHALKNGDYKGSVKEQPGSASVVQGIENDRFGIGYSGIGYQTSGVRALPLSPADGQPAVAASAEAARSGAYPLSRFLYVYVNQAPGKPLDRLTAEFIRFILSADGQRIVLKSGFDPIDAATAAKQLATIQK